MLYVEVPKEIKEYEPKVLFNLTMRQLIYGGMGIGLGLLTYFIGSLFIPTDFLSIIVMAVVALPFIFGFIPINDMPADKLFQLVWAYYKKGMKPLRYNNFSDGGGIAHVPTKQEQKWKRAVKKDRKKVKKEEFC